MTKLSRFGGGRGRHALAAAAMTAFTLGPAHAQDPLELGALMPMTGDLQAYGESSLSGIELAAQEINAAGGVRGQDLAIRVGDSQTRPQSGTDAAQRLISIEGVEGIVGGLSSGVTIPVAQSVTSEEGIPQISPASTSPVITGLDDNDFLFRTVPSDAFQGRALAEIVDAKGFDTVSALYINNDYGEGLAESFREAFEETGGSIAASLAYESGNASYRGELARAADGGAEALVLIGYPENGVTILRQALEGGHFREFVFTDGMKAPEIIDAIGAEYLNGSAGTAAQAQTDTDAATNFRSAYEKAYGEVPPKPYIDTAYDAVYLLALAAEQAEDGGGEALRDELRAVANPPGEVVLPGEWDKARQLIADGQEINYEGASGAVDFDDHGDVAGTFAHWVIRDGEIVTERVFTPSR
ncbi:MAG: ABC transporter substrate-binding protein [Halofilum sp. (in: g-proteobacteria)]